MRNSRLKAREKSPGTNTEQENRVRKSERQRHTHRESQETGEELAEAFQQDFVKSTKERLLLTAGVSAGRHMIDNSYQIKELVK
ncbi:hypothetical protein J1605_008046 [Eschrichtius robustus]|uniref:Uncharacterized protein n=1 Tax=Eschrichtius robustus TaxID=9764 RepID=A0AB34H1Y1_ESCRO|nr:hypothetical protein J1605_008046 [Eschrichtius robustus]